MFSFISRWFKTPNGLSKADVEAITVLRLAPETPLQGADLAKAESMVARGLLKRSGKHRFVLTEKGMIAYRSYGRT